MKDENYDLIESVHLSFNVTVLDYIVPEIQNQYYTLSTSPLQINYDQFRVIPSYYKPGPSHVEAFLLKGTSIPQIIDLKCNCLTNISEVEWLTHD